MPVKTFAEMQEALSNNKITYNPQLKEGTKYKILYPRDSTNFGNQPEFLIDTPLRMPFDLSAGKNKEITPETTTLNMELSLNVQEHSEIIDFFIKEYDSMTRSHAVKHSEEVFRRKLSDSDLSLFQYPSLSQSKKNPDLYLLRLKVQKNQTKVFVVQDGGQTADQNITSYRQGSLGDLQRGCSVIASIKHVMSWFSSSQFGSTYSALKILVFPYQRTQQPQQEDDSIGFPMASFGGHKLQLNEGQQQQEEEDKPVAKRVRTDGAEAGQKRQEATQVDDDDGELSSFDGE